MDEGRFVGNHLDNIDWNHHGSVAFWEYPAEEGKEHLIIER